jgi:hypothetical protein
VQRILSYSNKQPFSDPDSGGWWRPWSKIRRG